MGTVEIRTKDRVALLIAVIGAMVAGVAFGLPGDQIPMALIGGFLSGGGVAWVWGSL